MNKLQVVVVKLSNSFEKLWPNIGRELDVTTTICEANEPETITRDVAAVVVSAGGAEQDVFNWLDRHDTPYGVPVFVVGGDLGRRTATQIAARGATDCFALPEDIELLQNALTSAVQRRREALRRASLAEDELKNDAFSEIIGESAALKELLARAGRILPHGDATVLIMGETGTGKELLARAIHAGGPRRGSPFVAVNCSALPEHLIESELFGHEKGAFTNAHSSKPGLFEVAEGGTFFLDEIGTLPVTLQAKLLRVLQDKEVRRVGGTRSRTVDLRIIAATNDDLAQAIRAGSFRQDLYFRLAVITLELPPLRNRDEDVLLIARALVARLAEQHGIPAPPVNGDICRTLVSYHWPGNVRELKNAVERSLLLSPPGELDPRELVALTQVESPHSGPIPFPANLDDITSAAAQATLQMCSGNRSEAARRLGISRRRLRRLLNEERMTA